MSIKKFKEEALRKIKAVEKHFNEIESSIGTKNFAVKRGYGKLVSSNINKVVENHLLISVSDNRDSMESQWNRDERRVFDVVWEAMTTYWRNYAIEKGWENVIFVSSGSATGEDKRRFRDITKDEWRVLEHRIKKTITIQGPPTKWRSEGETITMHFCGGYLSERIKKKIAETLAFEEMMNRTIEEKGLLSWSDYILNLEEMFYTRKPFVYAGEPIGLELRFGNEKSETKILLDKEGETEVIEFSIEDLYRKFDEIEEERAFQNELEYPMDNFLKVMKDLDWKSSVPYPERESGKKEEFDRLSDKLGGWKKVESEFSAIQQNFTEPLMDWKDEVTSKRVEVHTGETDEHIFYFVFLNMPDNKNDLIKVRKKTEPKQKFLEYIYSLMMNHIE